jgi:thymidylate synthase (FAD)
MNSFWATDGMKVLDHGYLKLIETWGSDERVIEAARMSTDKGFLGWGPREDQHSCIRGGQDLSPSDMCAACLQGPGDEKLLRFLSENRHDTPFEFAGLVIEVQAPIFVFREWHRHRTQSYNEMSARYTPLPDVNYIPSVERLIVNSKTNRQAGTATGSAQLTEKHAHDFQLELGDVYKAAESLYQTALAAGVPKELARILLPVGRYSRMRAAANLRNWLAFLTLREAPNAQWEIRQYAHAVSALVREAFPRIHALYVERTAPAAAP